MANNCNFTLLVLMKEILGFIFGMLGIKSVLPDPDVNFISSVSIRAHSDQTPRAIYPLKNEVVAGDRYPAAILALNQEDLSPQSSDFIVKSISCL